MRARERHERFTIAESDLDDDRCIASKQRLEVERRAIDRRLDPEARPDVTPRTLLRRRHAACTRHEAADRAGWTCRHGPRLPIGFADAPCGGRLENWWPSV
jgi:hypothetical protein